MHFAYKELPANHKQLTLLVVREISDPYPRLAVLSRYRRNNMETEIKPLLTIKDVCPWLRFTPQTIKKMCREGKIPCIKIHKYWRFDKEEVSAWRKNQP